MSQQGQDFNESVCIEMYMQGAASLSGFTYLEQGVDQFCSMCFVSWTMCCQCGSLKDVRSCVHFSLWTITMML